jgi:predicted porin
MQKKMIVLALGAALVAPAAYADVELLGKAVQVYGKLHASVDIYDRGTETAGVTEPSGTEITSNSSRLGFKGEKELTDGVKGVWKFESEIDVSGESGTLAARNRYVGLSTVAGSLVLGIHDTPLKEMLGYTMFGDTVGDARSILGQVSSNDNQFNARAKSMVKYEIKVAGFTGKLMYSPDFDSDTDPDSDTGNSDTLTGVGVGYKIGGFDVGAAYEKQESIDNTLDKDATGARIGIKYKIGGLQVGAIYESLKDEGYGVRIARNAYGVNLAYTLAGITFAGQYLKAEESDLAAGSDGADQYSVGVFYEIAKGAQVYGMYGSLENDLNASYQLARSGHGQAFAPTQAGETVTAFSIGMAYSF